METTMDEEWHVSDSEDEQETESENHPGLSFMASNLKGLCTVSNQDMYTTQSDQLYIPKNLVALYQQIEIDGFIALRCKGSKRRVETIKNDTNINRKHHTNSQTTTSSISNETQAATGTVNEVPSPAKISVTRSEFDYDEDMETVPVVRLPKRKKSEIGKYRKVKRVGTMEKVIKDLDRFERLNAQAMAADNTQSGNS